MAISPEILISISALVKGETNLVANLANIAAHIYQESGWHWVGFYLDDREANNLVLGPFSGPVACTRLRRGKGVCSKAWSMKKTLLVNDIHSFEGHIACSPLSNSEVVIPIIVDELVVAVLDVDSTQRDGFSETEVKLLEELGKLIEGIWVD